MSLQNNGVARRIYEDADADLQLKVSSSVYPYTNSFTGFLHLKFILY